MNVETPSVALLMEVVFTTPTSASAVAVVANGLDDNEADDIVVDIVLEAVAFSNRVGGGVTDTVGPEVVGGVVLFVP